MQHCRRWGSEVNNNGTAMAADILKLIDFVADKVYKDTGVRLEREIRLVGGFGGEG